MFLRLLPDEALVVTQRDEPGNLSEHTMRKTLVLGSVAVVVVGLGLAAAPANAAAGDTLVTFTVGVTGSTVSIAPGVYVPGTGTATSADGTIVSVVTDLRTSAGSWTDAVSSTDYSLVGATSPTGTALIPATSAKMWTTTAAVTIPGTATINNTHTALGSALTLANSAATLLSATTANANVATLTSSLWVDTTGKATGAYTGTVTQTVS
jgi:hypothetical protein